MNKITYPGNSEILEFLENHNLLSTIKLNQVLKELEVTQETLGNRIFEYNLLGEENFAWLSSQLCNLPIIEAGNLKLEQDLFRNIPIDLIIKFKFFPITRIEGEIVIGLVNPFQNGVTDILSLIFGDRYQINILKASEFDKLLEKLDYTPPLINTLPLIEFSDDLLDEPDIQDDESCIAFTHYLILSLFSSRNRSLNLFPDFNYCRVQIMEGDAEVKNFNIDRAQYFLLLWRIKKHFNLNPDARTGREKTKTFFYDKKNYRLKIIIFNTEHGESALISHQSSTIVIENTPEFMIKNFKVAQYTINHSDSGLIIGYNNRLSKQLILEQLKEKINPEKTLVYLSSRTNNIPATDIPVIILDKDIIDFNKLISNLHKIYSYIIIGDFALSKYIDQLESLKRMIVLASSINVWSPVNYLRLILRKDYWKISNIAVCGSVFDLGNLNDVPLIVGDFFSFNNRLISHENDAQLNKIIETRRNELFLMIKEAYKLPDKMKHNLKMILGAGNGD